MGVSTLAAASLAGAGAAVGYAAGYFMPRGMPAETDLAAGGMSPEQLKNEGYYLAKGGWKKKKASTVSDEAVAGDVKKGAALFKAKCATCHSCLPGGPTKQGPNLYGIMGKDAAVRRRRPPIAVRGERAVRVQRARRACAVRAHARTRRACSRAAAICGCASTDLCAREHRATRTRAHSPTREHGGPGAHAQKSTGFKFTKNLAKAEIKWDDASMNSWLANPKAVRRSAAASSSAANAPLPPPPCAALQS